MVDTPLLDRYLSGKESAGGNTPLLDKFLASSVNDTVVTPVENNQQHQQRLQEMQTRTPAGNQPEPSMANKVGRLPIDIAKGYGGSVGETYQNSIDLMGSGVGDIRQNAPASGVGKIGLGALGAMVSPITGGLKEFIEKPITNLTGNPAIGERASLVAGSGLPIATAARGVSK